MNDNGMGYNWTRMYAHRDLETGFDHVGFNICNKDQTGAVTACVKQIVTETLKPEDLSVYRGPAFVLHTDACQLLMNDLWNIGIRPSHESSIGVGKAQESHLADLRRIVFKTLNIEG